MFIAALFSTDKIWKQSKCLSVEKPIKNWIFLFLKLFFIHQEDKHRWKVRDARKNKMANIISLNKYYEH